jgi:hypothetical protein
MNRPARREAAYRRTDIDLLSKIPLGKIAGTEGGKQKAAFVP